MRSFIKILSIALIYCGTVFGAGFASGQEIFRFFSAYGGGGIVSSVFVGFLFSFIGYVVCGQAKKYKLSNVCDYFSLLFPGKLSEVLSIFCNVFLAVTFCIMIAGCGALGQEYFGLRPVVGAVASLALCLFILHSRVQGLALLNGVITPFMFLGVTAFCILVSGNNRALPEVGVDMGALCSGVLYAGYNTVSAVATLVASTSIAETEREAKAGGILGGILVGVPLCLMTICLTSFPEASLHQLPFFSLVCRENGAFAPFCALILLGAMLTTAASAGVSVLAKVPQTKTGRYARLLCIPALCAALFPFDILVGFLYTAFGFSGLVLLFGILKSFLRK